MITILWVQWIAFGQWLWNDFLRISNLCSRSNEGDDDNNTLGAMDSFWAVVME